MKKIINWFKQSNRYKHLIYTALVCTPILVLPNYINVIYVAFLIGACLEFKDKKQVGIWDWNDLLSGVIIPVLISIVYIICKLV